MPEIYKEGGVLSDQENRPSDPVDYSKESQRLVDAAEKGKGKGREQAGNRRTSVIENYRGFTYEIFEDESKNQPCAMYDDIMQLIDDRNDALLETNEFCELVKELSDRNKAL